MPPAMPLMPPLLSKASSHELAGCANYLNWREQMVKLVEEGKKPPSALLTLLEASLHKLNDDDLKDEYRWYATQYTADDSSEALRAACEMIVIRIGEIVNMPQGARIDKRKHNKRLQMAPVTPRAAEVVEPPASGAEAQASFVEYCALRDEMIETRRSGWKPPMQMYSELDLRLFLLDAADQIREYKHLASIYLDESQAVAVRGLVELRLTKLGEILYTRLRHGWRWCARTTRGRRPASPTSPRARGLGGEPSREAARRRGGRRPPRPRRRRAPPAMGAGTASRCSTRRGGRCSRVSTASRSSARRQPFRARPPSSGGRQADRRRGRPVAAAGPDGKALGDGSGGVVPWGPRGGWQATGAGKPLDADGQARGAGVAAAAQQARQ